MADLLSIFGPLLVLASRASLLVRPLIFGTRALAEPEAVTVAFSQRSVAHTPLLLG